MFDAIAIFQRSFGGGSKEELQTGDIEKPKGWITVLCGLDGDEVLRGASNGGHGSRCIQFKDAVE